MNTKQTNQPTVGLNITLWNTSNKNFVVFTLDLLLDRHLFSHTAFMVCTFILLLMDKLPIRLRTKCFNFSRKTKQKISNQTEGPIGTKNSCSRTKRNYNEPKPNQTPYRTKFLLHPFACELKRTK